METYIYKVGVDDETTIYNKAKEILKSGGLVAFPTETVYGLGGNALDKEASLKIYSAKGRPSDNPLIVHIANVAALNDLCVDVPEIAYKLADKFWPGPLTMVLKKQDKVPYQTTGGLDTVAIRMPNHPVALKLIESTDTYIAAPSANLSGRPSPTSAMHVKKDMDGRIDMIIDGGSGEIGIESTIVDLTGEVPIILRPGFITFEMLQEAVGDVKIDPAIELGKVLASDVKPKAPGMKYRHYAPKGEMVVVEGSNNVAVVEKINELACEAKKLGKKTGIIATSDVIDKCKADIVLNIGDRNDEKSISSNLFDVLRKMDDLGAEYIVSEAFARHDVGYAIMNRLLKAAGGNIISV